MMTYTLCDAYTLVVRYHALGLGTLYRGADIRAWLNQHHIDWSIQMERVGDHYQGRLTCGDVEHVIPGPDLHQWCDDWQVSYGTLGAQYIAQRKGQPLVEV